jgi:hypothetical protein
MTYITTTGMRCAWQHLNASRVFSGTHSNHFWRILEMSFLKQKLTMPVVKYSVFGLASCLWVFGLVDQLYASASMMKYLLLSLLMAAVAFI